MPDVNLNLPPGFMEVINYIQFRMLNLFDKYYNIYEIFNLNSNIKKVWKN